MPTIHSQIRHSQTVTISVGLYSGTNNVLNVREHFEVTQTMEMVMCILPHAGSFGIESMWTFEQIKIDCFC